MGSINCFEPTFGWPGNTLKVSHKLIPKQRLGPRISERSDYELTLYRIPVYSNIILSEHPGSAVLWITYVFGLMRLLEPHTGAAAVLVDEFGIVPER